MWPPSLEAANQIGWWSNFFLICSLVVGVLSTIGIVVTTNIKEGYWDDDRRQSAKHIEQLRKDTAEANARALKSQVALEKYKAPRSLSPNQN